MKMREGTCKLCLEHKKLCRSHIVPNALYEKVKGEDNRISHLATNLPTGRQTLQSGLWESMLCRECEAILSRHEVRAIPIIKEIQKISEANNYVPIKAYTDKDIIAIRIMGLSMLYKAALSDIPDLTPYKMQQNFLNEIRNIIINNKRTDIRYLPLFLRAECKSKLANARIFFPPTTHKKLSKHYAKAIVTGSIWWIYIISGTSAYLSSDVLQLAVGNGNNLHILSETTTDNRVLKDMLDFTRPIIQKFDLA